ncbi:MAG: PilZ domain-containing protein [Deltaproteobacteria bacterium]|nr:PilZ domain-containing protein [Deltaproteobacteria bacterium]
MSASKTAEVLYPFKNSCLANILLPIVNEEVLELDCLVKNTDSTHFEATFLPGQLPLNNLSLDRVCKISFQRDGHCHILNTRIVRVLSPEKLLLFFKRVKVNPVVRDYFRVDARGKVSYQKLADQPGEIFDHQGVLNISGGGVRFPIRRSFSLGQKCRIGLAFNNPQPVELECTGEVVRAINFGKRPYVSLKFTDIDSKDRESLISFCMAVQREALRTKVQVVNFA